MAHCCQGVGAGEEPREGRGGLQMTLPTVNSVNDERVGEYGRVALSTPTLHTHIRTHTPHPHAQKHSSEEGHPCTLIHHTYQSSIRESHNQDPSSG